MLPPQSGNIVSLAVAGARTGNCFCSMPTTWAASRRGPQQSPRPRGEACRHHRLEVAPVASTATALGANGTRRAINASVPPHPGSGCTRLCAAQPRCRAEHAWCPRRAESCPSKHRSLRRWRPTSPFPCISGRAKCRVRRPKRQYGFDGPSATLRASRAFDALRSGGGRGTKLRYGLLVGLPPAPAGEAKAPTAPPKLQG